MTDAPTTPGWYPSDDGEQYWDGTAWTRKFRSAGHQASSDDSNGAEPDGPGMYFVLGIATWFAALFLLFCGVSADQEFLLVLAWAATALGSIFTFIGVIAQGVVVGLRTARRL